MIKWWYAIRFALSMQLAAWLALKANEVRKQAAIAFIMATIPPETKVRPEISDNTIYIMSPYMVDLRPGWFGSDKEATQFCVENNLQCVSIDKFRDISLRHIQKQLQEEK